MTNSADEPGDRLSIHDPFMREMVPLAATLGVNAVALDRRIAKIIRTQSVLRPRS
jgi:hypothetical protein